MISVSRSWYDTLISIGQQKGGKMLYTQADIMRGIGKPPQDWGRFREQLEALPHLLGVPRKDGTGARRYWHERDVIAWAAGAGVDFDPARARR